MNWTAPRAAKIVCGAMLSDLAEPAFFSHCRMRLEPVACKQGAGPKLRPEKLQLAKGNLTAVSLVPP